MHAAHPFVAIWDDHEVEDNYAGDQDPRATAVTSAAVPFERAAQERLQGVLRSDAADPGEGRPTPGSTARASSARSPSCSCIDQRQYRDVQPCDDAMLEPCPEADDPGRTLLGATQKEWLKRAVPSSKATWKLWGQPGDADGLDRRRGQPAIVDAWDGYAAERKEILEHLIANGVENLVALTGDIHTFFAGDISTTGRDDGAPAGVELVGGSATSLGLPEFLGVPSSSIYPLAPPNDPHIKYVELDRRGYGVATATKRDLTCEFKAVDVLTDGAPAQLLKSFRVADGDPHVQVL